MWLQRKAIDNSTFSIDNSTFRNQSDIGQAVQGWTENYNATHGKRITDILQIGVCLRRVCVVSNGPPELPELTAASV